MRWFVTGTSGFIGAALVRRLIAEGEEVAILLRENCDVSRLGSAIEECQALVGEFGKLEPIEPDLRLYRPEVAVHLGWAGVARGDRDDRKLAATSFSGSRSLMKLLERAKCPRWIGVGSQAEVLPRQRSGEQAGGPQVLSAYGATKRALGIEWLDRVAEVGASGVWMRLFAAYGPHDNPDNLIPHLITTLLRGKRPALTLGEQRWDYLFIDDVVEALVQVGRQSEAEGTFDLGSGEAVAVREIAEVIRDLIDPQLPLGFGEISYPPDQIMLLEAEPAPLREATGWSPRVPLREGLASTIAWHRSGGHE